MINQCFPIGLSADLFKNDKMHVQGGKNFCFIFKLFSTYTFTSKFSKSIILAWRIYSVMWCNRGPLLDSSSWMFEAEKE